MPRPRTVGLLSLGASLGLVVGAIGASAMVASHYNRMFRERYVLDIVEQAQIAKQIRNGSGLDLANRIEQTLPEYVVALEREYGRHDAVLPGLRSVKDFYVSTATPVPESIRLILDKLPPAPPASCDLPAESPVAKRADS